MTSGETKHGTSMEEFFPEVFKTGNLSEITWDHAVNSKALLEEALANDKHMIEADVLLGKLVHHTDSLLISVIMGHPPTVISDLTLKMFMDRVVEHNNTPGKRKKGVKLDFKLSLAYDRAMSSEILLNENNDALRDEYTKFPIWINGDIARGPGNPLLKGVDLQLDEMKKKPNLINSVIWSLGWTTTDYKDDAKYTFEQVDEMKRVVTGIANVTFPVRAMYAAKSLKEMESLLEVGTLTIWSAKQDDGHVQVDELVKLIRAHPAKVYVDVPDALWARIVAA